MTVKGLVFKIQRWSIHDGPGIRTTVFLKGCPLRCVWCSNPESQAAHPELLVNKSKCVPGCSRCIDACKPEAIVTIDTRVIVNRNACTNCGVCVEKCVSNALTLIGETVTAERVLGEFEKDTTFYEKSNGGITVSGGEPLFQPSFTGEILRLAKLRGMHTALDTSGYGTWNHLKKILKYVDLVLFDIKHMNSTIHRKYTGVTNKNILENALRISKQKNDMIIRIPVIPTINDSERNMIQLVEFVNKLENVKEIDLLPYHRFGASKYEMLGRKCELGNLQENEKVLLDIRNKLKGWNFEAKIVQ